MAYTTIDNPGLYFQVKTYSGNGGTQSVTLDGSENMQPDWVWIKNRGATASHILTDVIRGVTKNVFSDKTETEETISTRITSFDSDGFSLGSEANVNASSNTYVAWNWKANGSGSSNSDGTISSTVSANTTAGFSIVSYTGSSANSNIGTVGHGLGSVPKMLIVKDRDAASDWLIFNGNLDNNKILELNDSAAASTDANAWNNTAPTSSVFTIGDNSYTNANGRKFIAYCFNEVKGYSKFGTYTGNGNADGTFIYTGFRPAWLMIKQSSASGEHWFIYDNKRSVFNVVDDALNANENSAEFTGSGNNDLDILSNGFKLRATDARQNSSGSTYIYMAFAEAPFVTAGTKAAGTAR